jgi:hypothetical protein
MKSKIKFKGVDKAGIYTILNLVNNKMYIGSSKNLGIRAKTHFTSLKNGVHDNSYLQNAWNKYGGCNFVMLILEYVDDLTTLEDREQYYMDIMLGAKLTLSEFRNRGYNLKPNAKNNLGFKWSVESKRKQSEAKKGKQPSTKSIERTVELRSKKIYQYDLDGNFIREWKSSAVAGRDLNIDQSSIRKCVKGKLNHIGGFVWREYLNLNGEITGKRTKSVTDINGNIFSSPQQCADFYNLSISTVYHKLRGIKNKKLQLSYI